ncbi:MAG TPA: NADH-quinone oxidoreductase subunit NuoE [Nitrospirota bacterium]|nr:NADH-quinone oxidoreductase subunit NuoE [Nitrospirota bacterium]
MLTEQEKKEIAAELQHSAVKQSASIEALKVIQRHRGWVSDEAVKDIAGMLEMSPDELDGIATFYNMIFRRPVGRHVILVCDSISCWVMGYGKIREHLKDRLGIELGGTTSDNRFTLLPNVCLGTCDHAPAMMIDNDTYRDLSPEKVDEILGRYR